MKKSLTFEIKQNLHRPPRVYVKSPDLKKVYGSFNTDNPDSFDGWEHLTEAQAIELMQYIQNVTAINEYLNPVINRVFTDFRFRLPVNIINTLNGITALCNKEKIELNIYTPMILNLVQQMKIAASRLSEPNKTEAHNLLNMAGIAEYKKMDFDSQIQAIFTDLLSIHNKSEKLHEKAKLLFQKDKSYSPKAIESMASGLTNPSRWLVSAALDVLIEEKIDIMKIISEDDFFMLWAKPLLDNGFNEKMLLSKIQSLKMIAIEEKINNYPSKTTNNLNLI